MKENKYILPVKRIGNARNPRVVILLSNPGGDWRMYKRLPDYAMYLDGKYTDQGGQIKTAQEYNAWWDDFVNVARTNGMDSKDILALEYYPYHTVSSSEIPKYKDWTDYAKCALAENIDILKNCMRKGVPVFGYYHGLWTCAVPELKTYTCFYKSAQSWKNNKIKEFRAFLESRCV